MSAHTPYSETHRQRKYRFPNGFGASVVCDPYTYGGDRGLFELAVLDESGALTYTTPITSDVVGWLSEDDVQETLGRIAALDAGEVETLNAAKEAERAKIQAQTAELAERLREL